ncbi:LamG domain-containing protein [Akkermansiaceae bacterium]|nr:LamG domain-containing protein [Akkermansiaceae bacterium]MDB4562780.1 LamG domain-containing protein [Akkermansiaceae bacterium]
MKHSLKSLLFLILGAVLPLSAKLTAWYPLDESSLDMGTTTAELIAGNDATVPGFDADPALSSTLRGGPSALQSLGTAHVLNSGDNNLSAISLGSDSTVQPTDQFTFTCYFQPEAFDNFDRIFESLDGNGAALNGIRIDLGVQGNTVRFLVRDGSGGTTQFTHPTVLENNGSWYFLAFRYDSTNTDDQVMRTTVLKLDGSVIDEAAITAATRANATVNTGPLGAVHSLGTVIGGNNPNGGGFALDGAIDELAFYDNSDANGVLSDLQLAENAKFGPTGVELVTSFTSDLASVSPGSPATFSWTINEPFDALSLDDGAGNITDLAPLTTAGEGSTMVSPNETTTYYLKGVNGSVVNVYALKILAGAAPEISSFTASASVVSTGSTVDLAWTVIAADSLVLDPGMQDVSGLSMSTETVTENTTYTLTATNDFGSTMATVIVKAFDGVVPAHFYVAGNETNTDATWQDEVAGKNIAIDGVFRGAPLATASSNTNITGAYTSETGLVGGSVGAFQFPDTTFEIWLRPGAITADHGVIFETGGGQNGVAALLNEDGLRFIGSAGNVRTLDVVVPLTGMNLEDFIQVVFSNSVDTDAFEVSVRDTFGIVHTASEVADVVMGGNGAVVFAWGSGGVGGDEINLGGRTEVADTSPAGLTSFVGEIGLINIYDQILDATQIKAAFDSVATTTSPPSGGPNAVTAISYDGTNMVTLTWNSVSGTTYDAEFSADLDNWFPLEQTIEATASETTNGFVIPADRPEFFLRIIEVTP